MQLLHQLSRQTDKTIFLSTHDLELALQIADKNMADGQGERRNYRYSRGPFVERQLSNFFARKYCL